MEFLPEEIEKYVELHTAEENDVLKELSRETWAKVLMPRMLSGHIQGRVLSMLSHMIHPKRILEIGTYTGYSAICLSEGLAEDGKLITIDNNEELKEMSERYFDKSGFGDKIQSITGSAIDVIPSLTDQFDLVFIDADKENYSNYLDLVLPKVRQGGFIIADNVLWSGKVIEPESKKDKDTEALKAYSKKVQNDDRVENVLFPVRDGLMVCRVK